ARAAGAARQHAALGNAGAVPRHRQGRSREVGGSRQVSWRDDRLVVDGTYRWVVVLLMTAAYASCLVPAYYRVGFPRKGPLQQIAGGAAMIGVGVFLSLLYGESAVDALRLQAVFGFMVPDSGIHGYGW